MIKVLHFFPKEDNMIALYVDTLCNAMGSYADVQAAHTLLSFHSTLRKQSPDIVHIHGCWRTANLMAAHYATSQGARIVFSPHGGLEPWIVKRHYWREKLPQLLLYQRRLAKRAFAVVAMGRMEAECLRKLRYNPRTETILNSLITEALTDGQMASEMHAVYRKVLDSNVWPLMEEQTHVAVKALIKACTTGDDKWLSAAEYQAVGELEQDEWRKVMLYAYQEGILDTVTHGISVVGKQCPDVAPDTVAHYTPAKHSPSTPLSPTGNDSNDTLANAMKAARKRYRTHKLSISHIVELDSLVRNMEFAEDKLPDSLNEKHLLPFARSMMKAIADLTGLEEGMMPIIPKAGRRAESIKRRITQNLNI